MATIRGPLHSLAAHGQLAKTIIYEQGQFGFYAKPYKSPDNGHTPQEQAARAQTSTLMHHWSTLTLQQQTTWDALAIPNRIPRTAAYLTENWKRINGGCLPTDTYPAPWIPKPPTFYQAAAFNASAAQFADTYLPAGGNAETVSAWIRTHGAGPWAITQRGTTSPTHRRHLYIDYTGWQTARLYFGGYSADVWTDDTPTPLSDGNWHHLAYVYDGAGHIALYADNHAATCSNNGDLYDNTPLDTPSGQDVHIGYAADAPGALDLQELQYYAEALDATAIADLWHNGDGKHGQASGHTAAALYHLDGDLTDASGNANNASGPGPSSWITGHIPS
jgi:hypothetical protein